MMMTMKMMMMIMLMDMMMMMMTLTVFAVISARIMTKNKDAAAVDSWEKKSKFLQAYALQPRREIRISRCGEIQVQP